MLQNATPLRKWPPGPPNSSDEDVSCTAPATENASLQILFKCPTPAIVFVNATKPSRVAHFSQGPQSLAPATRKHIWTSKSGPNPWCFVHFDFDMCFAPKQRALFQHRNFQKWSEAGVFCTCWLRNVLRATTACTFSTSERPKVVRSWCVLYMLTSKCASRQNGLHFFDIATSKSGPKLVCFAHLTSKRASRHNGVHFFDIWTSKSGPKLVCFVHVDFEMYFAPKRPALFRHRNFQKWSEAGVFCTFDFEMCFAPQRSALFRHRNF